MEIKKDKVIQEFNLIAFGAKGWMSGHNLKCPECGREDKFGVIFNKRGGTVHCFVCEYTESIFKFLKKIGRTDLINYDESISLDNKLTEPVFNKVDDLTLDELPEVGLPKGFERIYYDGYLAARNFKSYQYDQFEVGVTNHFLEKRLHDKLIFVIKQGGKRVAWIARSKNSYEWHKENLRLSKEKKCRLVLRYENSKNTDFDSIIGGYDEITDNTHTVILTEGLFDKVNVSNLLRTNSSEELKVLFTFGNKVSNNQIKLLRKTNIGNIVLLYDFATVKQSKKYSTELSRWFNVDVCYIDKPDIDPGNIDSKYLIKILKEKKNFYYFYNSKLSINLK